MGSQKKLDRASSLKSKASDSSTFVKPPAPSQPPADQLKDAGSQKKMERASSLKSKASDASAAKPLPSSHPLSKAELQAQEEAQEQEASSGMPQANGVLKPRRRKRQMLGSGVRHTQHTV